eukprot:7910788-Heterocapsa_arctica.AAC.1
MCHKRGKRSRLTDRALGQCRASCAFAGGLKARPIFQIIRKEDSKGIVVGEAVDLANGRSLDGYG